MTDAQQKQAPSTSHSPFLTWLWGEGGRLACLRFPFTLVAYLYRAVIRCRVLLYKWGIFSSKRVNCRVVSIGNITAGGTGKTPLTLYFAEQWQKRGSKVGIVSRGYGRKSKASLLLVSDGEKVLERAEAVGDEPALMAERLSGIPIVVSADRVLACDYLIDHFSVDLILLDDAYQHLKIQRDQNIVLVDASQGFGNGYLLPRGMLREPLSQLSRADALIFTRVRADSDLEPLLRQLKHYSGPMLRSQFLPTDLFGLTSNNPQELSSLSGQRILPVCGIGNPESFLKQLDDLGAIVCSPIVFEDHHHYTVADLNRIADLKKKEALELVVTTEKDAVKLKALVPLEGLDFCVLRIGPVFEKDFLVELAGLFD